MKEIKFRGKSRDLKTADEWVVGDLLRPSFIIPLWDIDDPHSPILNNLDFILVDEASIG